MNNSGIFTICCFVYVAMMVMSAGKVMEDRPLPKFWAGLGIAFFSPIILGIRLLGNALIFIGCQFLGMDEATMDRLAPYRSMRQHENRQDLH